MKRSGNQSIVDYLCVSFAITVLGFSWLGTNAQASDEARFVSHRVESASTTPEDVRRLPVKDLNGYFPFSVPSTVEEWQLRAEEVRRRILVSQGLWPMPTKTPLNAVIHGRVERDDFVVDKVFFESAPGLFVTGNLYRPKSFVGKIPAVMFAHGHWQDARLSIEKPEKLRQEIASGEERFEMGGQSRFQSMCIQLARMGCLVWQWDMLSDSDAIQIPREVIHKFAKQRPEMNTLERWGLFSPQAEAHLQSVMGLQTWNAIRSLDFVLTLPEVDANRIAITGASGGGTQTMLLAAIDSRITLSFPAVMVSTAMQGGCTCENSSLLRIGTGNVEFAALFAPKPQGMTCANDWTKEMSTKGFPELRELYKLMGAPKNVMLHRGEHFPHNYNAVSRSAFYTWLNQHFKLGFDSPVIEKDFAPLARSELSVWNDKYPAPKAADPEFERSLLEWFHLDTQSQLVAGLMSKDPTATQTKTLQPAFETLIGRSYEKTGDIEWVLTEKNEYDAFVSMKGYLHNTTHREVIEVAWLYPKKWNGKVVVWLEQDGNESINQGANLPTPIDRLAQAGYTIVVIEPFHADAMSADTRTKEVNRLVANPREFAGYTYGYNHSLFAQRVHDVISVVRFLRTAQIGDHPQPNEISLVGLQGSAPIAIATRAVLGDKIDKLAVSPKGFRFGKLRDFRDADFLPGGAKYLDLVGMLASSAPSPLWIKTSASPDFDLLKQLYAVRGPASSLTLIAERDLAEESEALQACEWLMK